MTRPAILFRADASHALGLGHVARLCALVDEVDPAAANPIALFGDRCLKDGVLTEADLKTIEKTINDVADEAGAVADTDPGPDGAVGADLDLGAEFSTGGDDRGGVYRFGHLAASVIYQQDPAWRTGSSPRRRPARRRAPSS